MKLLLQTLLGALVAIFVDAACQKEWAQCGGKYYKGATCCIAPAVCVPQKNNIYYSQCLVPPKVTPPTHAPTSPPPCAELFEQCGGENWKGSHCCQSGLECISYNPWYAQCKESSGTPKPTPKPTARKTSKPTPIGCSNGKSCGFIADGASPEGNDGTICCADNEECYLDPLNITGLTKCAKSKERYACELPGGYAPASPCNYAFNADSSLISQPSVCCDTTTDGCYLNADKNYMKCIPNTCEASETRCGYEYTSFWTGSGETYEYVFSEPTTCCSATQVCGPSKTDDYKYVCSDFSCPADRYPCGAYTSQGSPEVPNNKCCASDETCDTAGNAFFEINFCVRHKPWA